MNNKELKKELDHNIASQIKNKRTSLGITMQEMGDYLGIQKSTYHYYESGRTSMDIYTIMAICEKLGMNWIEVLENAKQK